MSQLSGEGQSTAVRVPVGVALDVAGSEWAFPRWVLDGHWLSRKWVGETSGRMSQPWRLGSPER